MGHRASGRAAHYKGENNSLMLAAVTRGSLMETKRHLISSKGERHAFAFFLHVPSVFKSGIIVEAESSAGGGVGKYYLCCDPTPHLQPTHTHWYATGALNPSDCQCKHSVRTRINNKVHSDASPVFLSFILAQKCMCAQHRCLCSLGPAQRHT